MSKLNYIKTLNFNFSLHKILGNLFKQKNDHPLKKYLITKEKTF